MASRRSNINLGGIDRKGCVLSAGSERSSLLTMCMSESRKVDVEVSCVGIAINSAWGDLRLKIIQ
jgi:hypothetical protein